MGASRRTRLQFNKFFREPPSCTWRERLGKIGMVVSEPNPCLQQCKVVAGPAESARLDPVDQAACAPKAWFFCD